MIVRMKRLTLVCRESRRDEALEALGELGVVHVTPVRPPEGAELDALRARLADARRALAALPARPEAGADPDAGAEDAPDRVAAVLEVLARRRELEEAAAALESQLARYAPFGDVDPEAVRRLDAAGVWTALAVAPAREHLEPPEGVALAELGGDHAARYLLLTGVGGHPEEPPDLGGEYELVPWPPVSTAGLRADLERGRAEREALDGRLLELAAGRDAVERYAAETAGRVSLEEVRAGMAETAELAALQGYVPAVRCDAVRDAAAGHGWAVVFADPQEGDDVPVQLHQARWVRPVRTVFDFLNIYPGYWESDVGWVFLPFFSLFFAIIVGDAGYACLLLALTAVLQWRFRRIPRHMLAMMYIVGGATLVWGVLTGSYFGIPTLPPALESLSVPWLAERDNLIDLCFFIGAVHLSFAHVWNFATYVSRRDWYRVPSQIGWLLVVWSMFFLARQAVLGRGMPSYLLYLLGLGIVLVAVFMKTPREIREEWIDHAMLPLTMVGNFVDILSYIRLFAVGYASVAVLAAFNGMAASIGFDSVFTAVAASLLLLFANALNIVLAGLGVLVHAVRLNTLEFSTHKGLAWQGHTLYAPFARRRETA